MSSYPGGKGSVYQQIINFIPPHDVYIELHLGGGSVMRNKRPARLNIGIDIDEDVLSASSSVICDEAAAASFVTMPAAPLEGIAINDDRIRHPSSFPTMAAAIVENDDTAVSPFVTMQAHTVTNDDDTRYYFLCGDALWFLNNYKFTGSEFIYSDPPYLMSTRKSKRRIYKNEYTRQDHICLLDKLITLPCKVAISGYYSKLYETMLQGWHTHTFTAQTRGGKTATEWLWMNYKPPTKLHDYTHLGENFRERQRIKRKKERWVKKLQGMDVLERHAIMWAIDEAGIEL